LAVAQDEQGLAVCLHAVLSRLDFFAN
jgi:hypothetical protein